MGNRAVLAFSQNDNSPCIYLHWDGGRDSVEGFLQAARNLGLCLARRNSQRAETRALDALADMLDKHFYKGEIGTRAYREKYGETDIDNGDNGVYILNKDLTIGNRLYNNNAEQTDKKRTREIADYLTAHAPRFGA